MSMNTSFFSDLLASIADRGRSLLGLQEAPGDSSQQAAGLVELCEALLSGRGEASGVAVAHEVLERYERLGHEGKVAFFEALARDFGPDVKKVEAAFDNWRANPSEKTSSDLHFLAEPRRQELFRRLNRAPGGTATLVRMRRDLLHFKREHKSLDTVDRCLVHLLSSWFNRGFLVLRRIDWSTPANILEKIIRYEAVHEISNWDELRRRLDPPDRRLYAFFHPALADEPLIFVEVALTSAIPDAIQPLLASDRTALAPQSATTAVFYSISNAQAGLNGVSFGNFLIKQVVEDLKRELPRLQTFVTLSPVPGFARWLAQERADETSRFLGAEPRRVLEAIEAGEAPESADRTLSVLAAAYFLQARTSSGRVIDPVARFHLGNGARLERINARGDLSPAGLRQSLGVMVNYLYDPDQIEANHEAFANRNVVAASSAVKKLAAPFAVKG